MGKKGTKRRTRWKALPLAGEDGGSGNEDELQDDEQSTTSSGRIVLRMGERSYRSSRRYPYDRDRSREPLVKLESKTFDEEEYTKITTPRQDVLFKKGYFTKRKNESSSEENNCNLNEEGESEEGPMEQLIITNGFVDERGHYLVNGTSYEIYDPYTNTVTVMVGPPPYTSGVTPPVLAAVSCQPVPLQPVDWYPPGPGDWPAGPAWTPAFMPTTPKAPETASSEGGSTTGSEEPPPPVFAPPPPFIFPSGMPMFPMPFPSSNGVAECEDEDDSRCGTPSVCPESMPTSPLPQQVAVGEDISETDPPKEEIPIPQKSIQSEEPPPRPQLNPAGPEFVPRYPLRPNGIEFVPKQPFQPNGVVFLPRPQNELPVAPSHKTKVVNEPHLTINPATQRRLSPTELQSQDKVTISKPQEPEQTKEVLNVKEPKVTPSVVRQLQVMPQNPVTTDTGQIKDSPKENSPKIVQSNQTPNELPRKLNVTQTSLPDGTKPQMKEERKQPNATSSPRHSVKKPPQTTVNNKSTVIDTSKNSRRSYAKTVRNGLEQPEVVPNELIMANGLTNGTVPHDSEDSMLGHELKGSNESSKLNGTMLNGSTVKKFDAQKVNGTTVNGPTVKKFDASKDTAINGVAGEKDNKERPVNGKINKKVQKHISTTNGTTRLPKSDKRTERNEKIVNGGVDHLERHFEDSDGDNFIPVENKRNNRTNHNGYTKNEAKSKMQKDRTAEVKHDTKDEIGSKKEKNKPIPDTMDNAFKNKTSSINKISPKLDVGEAIEKSDIGANVITQEEKAVVPEKTESDKSSTISDLSSPTELSSGQTTPPNKITDLKLEEKRANELSKSMEKLKENLAEETEVKKSKKKAKKKVVKEEVKKNESFESTEDVPLPDFLQPPQDELAHLDALLGGAATNAILRSLRVNEPSIAKVNLFPPRAAAFPCDIYTKTNLSNMRATRPEEFFASIVETPVPVEPLKVAEKPKKSNKAVERLEAVRDSPVVMLKSFNTAYKPSKKREVKKEEIVSIKTEEKSEKVEQRLGIVDAVKTWLESQEETEQTVVDVDEGEISSEPKNELSNPLHASSPERGGQEDQKCNRVAEVTTENGVIPKKTFFNSTKSLAESPRDHSTPELAALVDARTSVDKYYSLSPCGDSPRQSVTSETSEQEAIDALEYPFPRPASADVVDPGPFPTKELACKLQ